MISFRIDWFDLLAVQGTLRSLLQHHSSKASIFQHSAFFILQLSHPYMTTGKTIALSRRTFVGQVMSLLFNMLSRLVITFLPRSKHLLISWLQSWSGAAAERSFPTSKLRGGGREELPHAPGQGQRPRGATPPPRSGCCGARRAERSYSTFKVRRGGHEKVPLVQGKEQWLRFAGAALKRYPTSEVRETQVRW